MSVVKENFFNHPHSSQVLNTRSLPTEGRKAWLLTPFVDRSKRSTKTSSGMVIRSGSNPLPSVRFARIG